MMEFIKNLPVKNLSVGGLVILGVFLFMWQSADVFEHLNTSEELIEPHVYSELMRIAGLIGVGLISARLFAGTKTGKALTGVFTTKDGKVTKKDK